MAGLFDRRAAHKVATPVLSEASESEPGFSNRQVNVHGYEFDVKELQHTMSELGRVVSIPLFCSMPCRRSLFNDPYAHALLPDAEAIECRRAST